MAQDSEFSQFQQCTLNKSPPGQRVLCTKENAPGFARGVFKKSELSKLSIELLLRWLRWRRSGRFGCRRLWSWRSTRRRVLNRISLVIKANDVLRDIDLI